MLLRLSITLIVTIALNHQIVLCQSNYDIDFETAVLSGIFPNESWIIPRNESDPFKLQSSPGCPEAFNGQPWVFYGNPVKCYLTGFQYPCPENMKLYYQRSSFYGYCDCNCAHNYGPHRPFCTGKAVNETEDRTLVYVKDTDSCQILFDQGSCPEGNWLVFGDDPKGGPFCESRRCPVAKEKDKFSFYDYQTKSCHTTGDSKPENENEGTFCYFLDADWVPVCRDKTYYFEAGPSGQGGTSFGIGSNQCFDGLKYSNTLGTCIPSRNTTGSGIG